MEEGGGCDAQVGERRWVKRGIEDVEGFGGWEGCSGEGVQDAEFGGGGREGCQGLGVSVEVRTHGGVGHVEGGAMIRYSAFLGLLSIVCAMRRTIQKYDGRANRWF